MFTSGKAIENSSTGILSVTLLPPNDSTCMHTQFLVSLLYGLATDTLLVGSQRLHSLLQRVN